MLRQIWRFLTRAEKKERKRRLSELLSEALSAIKHREQQVKDERSAKEDSDCCLLLIRDKLVSLGHDMTHCPPMFYPEAIHNSIVPFAIRARDLARKNVALQLVAEDFARENQKLKEELKETEEIEKDLLITEGPRFYGFCTYSEDCGEPKAKGESWCKKHLDATRKAAAKTARALKPKRKKRPPQCM